MLDVGEGVAAVARTVGAGVGVAVVGCFVGAGDGFRVSTLTVTDATVRPDTPSEVLAALSKALPDRED